MTEDTPIEKQMIEFTQQLDAAILVSGDAGRYQVWLKDERRAALIRSMRALLTDTKGAKA